jgi:hypothetical protein
MIARRTVKEQDRPAAADIRTREDIRPDPQAPGRVVHSAACHSVRSALARSV